MVNDATHGDHVEGSIEEKSSTKKCFNYGNRDYFAWDYRKPKEEHCSSMPTRRRWSSKQNMVLDFVEDC